MWRNPSAPYPLAVKDLFTYVRRACEQLLEALDQLPMIAADTSRTSADRTAANTALRHRDRWITALREMHAAADLDVAERAVQAWDLFLAARPDPNPQPILHLEGFNSRLFAVVGAVNVPASLGPSKTRDTRQVSSESLAPFTCPACKFFQRVPIGTTKSNCRRCGKEIVWRRCEQTGQTVAVLPEWTAWIHKGCNIQHPMNPT
jgi:hypothetical protein